MTSKFVRAQWNETSGKGLSRTALRVAAEQLRS
jgi:hypothetical protein